MSFESIAYVFDTYMWFLLGALVIGIVAGWVAADTPNPSGEQQGE